MGLSRYMRIAIHEYITDTIGDKEYNHDEYYDQFHLRIQSFITKKPTNRTQLIKALIPYFEYPNLKEYNTYRTTALLNRILNIYETGGEADITQISQKDLTLLAKCAKKIWTSIDLLISKEESESEYEFILLLDFLSGCDIGYSLISKLIMVEPIEFEREGKIIKINSVMDWLLLKSLKYDPKVNEYPQSYRQTDNIKDILENILSTMRKYKGSNASSLIRDSIYALPEELLEEFLKLLSELAHYYKRGIFEILPSLKTILIRKIIEGDANGKDIIEPCKRLAEIDTKAKKNFSTIVEELDSNQLFEGKLAYLSGINIRDVNLLLSHTIYVILSKCRELESTRDFFEDLGKYDTNYLDIEKEDSWQYTNLCLKHLFLNLDNFVDKELELIHSVITHCIKSEFIKKDISFSARCNEILRKTSSLLETPNNYEVFMGDTE